MDLDYLLSVVQLSDDSILQRVDEYTLYCYYLGFEPLLRFPYKSPLRTGDSDPSFSMFLSEKDNREYFWKDSGGDTFTGVAGDSGDIFKLIQILYGDTLKECYSRINRDFELGYDSDTPPPVNAEKIVRYSAPKEAEASNIRIKRRKFFQYDIEFWLQFGITASTLKKFRVIPLFCFWMFDSQQYPIRADKLAYSYPINGKHKIYQPLSKNRKFRNNYDYMCLEGFDQLSYTTDTLIITKSSKDIMVLYEYGYEAVSPRGESMPIREEFLNHFRKKYKRILVFFDNDGKHKADDFPFPSIFVPIESHEKDISDFRRRYGHKQTELLLKKLINT